MPPVVLPSVTHPCSFQNPSYQPGHVLTSELAFQHDRKPLFPFPPPSGEQNASDLLGASRRLSASSCVTRLFPFKWDSTLTPKFAAALSHIPFGVTVKLIRRFRVSVTVQRLTHLKESRKGDYKDGKERSQTYFSHAEVGSWK